MPDSSAFTIEIDGAVTLELDEIWPDGDVPENPTLSDVIPRLEKEGTAANLIREWNLPVEVSVDGQKVNLR